MAERVAVDEDLLVNVFRALEARPVEYAVLGAIALGLHGLARATADLDLFIRRSSAPIRSRSSASSAR
ncbi:MAG: hypothetical protein U0610_32220 [bacterium]